MSKMKERWEETRERLNDLEYDISEWKRSEISIWDTFIGWLDKDSHRWLVLERLFVYSTMLVISVVFWYLIIKMI